jgi:hypothetical protein
MSKFKQGNTYGKGRPKNSRNKVNKEVLYRLLDDITEDFNTNYDKLTTNQKLRLLIHFSHLYKTDEEIESGLEPKVLQIISSDAELKKLYNVE